MVIGSHLSSNVEIRLSQQERLKVRRPVKNVVAIIQIRNDKGLL